MPPSRRDGGQSDRAENPVNIVFFLPLSHL